MLPSDVDEDQALPNPDLAVIGNGALGLAIAIEHRRRRPDATVMVIGPTVRPGSASMAAGIAAMSTGRTYLQTVAHWGKEMRGGSLADSEAQKKSNRDAFRDEVRIHPG